MVKRTNRIHNLNKMIQEYKREQEKFEVIQQDILNQQKQIEDLRLLILSTNFKNTDSSTSSMPNSSTPKVSSKHISTSLKEKEINRKESKKFKDDQIKHQKIKISSKSKVFQDDQVNKSDKGLNGEQDQMTVRLNKELADNRSNKVSNRPKGLQTVSKNMLNQKESKYSNNELNSKLVSESSNELKKDQLVKKNDQMFKKTDNLVKLVDSVSINDESNDHSLLNKFKPTTGELTMANKFENQENPINVVNKGLGINKISKSIIKKAKQIKSTPLMPTKPTNRLHFI